MVHLRQYARVHRRPDREHDRPDDPEERRLRRIDRPRRAEGLRAQPASDRPLTVGTHHPGADVSEVIAMARGGLLPERATDAKTGMPTIIPGVDPSTGESFIDPSADMFAGYCGAGKDGRMGRDERVVRHLGRRRPRSTSRCFRTCNGAATTAPTTRPGQWRGICGSLYEKDVTATPRCTRTSSAGSTRCRGSAGARTARRTR